MSRKAAILLSTGISTALIAVAIWLLLYLNAGIWAGSGPRGMGYRHLLGGALVDVRLIFWAVLFGAIALLTAGVICGLRAARRQQDALRRSPEILARR
ncbi:MAG: hypothetical protein QNJ22_21615 [Desulfosarcinaceae bacterium]|nr:hypothetical protein [Desulfosarcinaceae bacterium]